jgi:enoyl-CoA hydratase/carnithine racemase
VNASDPSTFTLRRSANGSIVTLTLRRAECLDIAGKQELTDAFSSLQRDTEVRAVIVASEHPHALLVSVDELAEMTSEDALAYSRTGQQLIDAMEQLPVPIIAAVSTAALGGGCELVLGCDLAVCTEGASFGQIEVNGGVVPAFGGTWRLVRRVGYQRAAHMIFTGGTIDATTAQSIGLVLEVVSDSAILARCVQLANEISVAGRGAVSEAKLILTRSSGRSPETANAMEQASFAALFGTADQRQRMAAFVAEHGK